VCVAAASVSITSLYAKDDKAVPLVQTQDESTPFDSYCDMFPNWRSEFDRAQKAFYYVMNQMNEQFDFAPTMDVVQTDSQYILLFDLPGMEKENVTVEIKEDILTVSGIRKDKWSTEKEVNGKYIYRTAKKYGQFMRSVKLPEGIDAKTIGAEYKNGVLEITLKYAQPEVNKEAIKVAIA